jgi:catechol 2,3-dioxygenase-like lactoylglutathione lyase family enzyme
MQTNGFFPILISTDLDATHEFYTTHLGFQVVFQNEWYLHLANASGVQLGFLLPNQPTQPDFLHRAYPGSGVLYSLEVADAAAAYEQLRAQGVPLLLDLRDEPWGQRHCIIQDPNGLPIDIVQSTPPEPEYARHYSNTDTTDA